MTVGEEGGRRSVVRIAPPTGEMMRTATSLQVATSLSGTWKEAGRGEGSRRERERERESIQEKSIVETDFGMSCDLKEQGISTGRGGGGRGGGFDDDIRVFPFPCI